MGTCAVLSTLQSGDEEVESALVPFLQAYVAKLRAGQKRGSPASQVCTASHNLPAICFGWSSEQQGAFMLQSMLIAKDSTVAWSCWTLACLPEALAP